MNILLTQIFHLYSISAQILSLLFNSDYIYLCVTSLMRHHRVSQRIRTSFFQIKSRSRMKNLLRERCRHWNNLRFIFFDENIIFITIINGMLYLVSYCLKVYGFFFYLLIYYKLCHRLMSVIIHFYFYKVPSKWLFFNLLLFRRSTRFPSFSGYICT